MYDLAFDPRPCSLLAVDSEACELTADLQKRLLSAEIRAKSDLSPAPQPNFAGACTHELQSKPGWMKVSRGHSQP